MKKQKRKIDDRVWTGKFWRDKENRLCVSIRERRITSVQPNYLAKYGLRYGAVSVGKPEYFSMAYRPEELFDNEEQARDAVAKRIAAEIATLAKLLGELPTLSTGEKHAKSVDV